LDVIALAGLDRPGRPSSLAREAGNDQVAAYHYMRKSNITGDAYRQDLAIRWAQLSPEFVGRVA